MIFEPFITIPTVDSAALDGICKNTDGTQKDLKGCIEETSRWQIDSKNAGKYLETSYAVTKLADLLEKQKRKNTELENQIHTFEQSVSQQEEPESTLTIKAQTTGPFAIPRPLRPIGIALLFGLSFLFLFTCIAFLHASLPTGGSSSFDLRSFMSFNTVKNIAIGILAISLLFVGLALAKVI